MLIIDIENPSNSTHTFTSQGLYGMIELYDRSFNRTLTIEEAIEETIIDAQTQYDEQSQDPKWSEQLKQELSFCVHGPELSSLF